MLSKRLCAQTLEMLVTRKKRYIWVLDIVLAMNACVALLNYAHSKRFEQPLVSSPEENGPQAGGGGYRSTVDAYELMVAYSPYDPTLRRKLGDAYYYLAQDKKGTAVYKEALTQQEYEADLKSSDLYFRKADAAYREALRLNPKDYETNLRLAHLSVAIGNYDYAQKSLDAARRIAPDSADVMNPNDDFIQNNLYDRFLSEHLTNPRSAYVAATEYLARFGKKSSDVTRYLRRWVEEFEKRVPPEERPLKNPPDEN